MTQALEYHEIMAVFDRLAVRGTPQLVAALADAARDKAQTPIPMVLYCPNCGVQHIDAPEIEPGRLISSGPNAGRAVPATTVWDNPPHRSHKCKACECVWRPADVATTGVDSTQTEGKADTWPNGLPDDARAATAERDDSQDWDRQAEALTQAAGLGGGKINPNATSVMDLFLDDEDEPPVLSAYDLGKAAFFKALKVEGYAELANPYALNSQDAEDFARGCQDAYQESR